MQEPSKSDVTGVIPKQLDHALWLQWESIAATYWTSVTFNNSPPPARVSGYYETLVATALAAVF